MAPPQYLQILLLLCTLPSCLSAQTQVLLGSELSADGIQTWLSENGTFAFGFASTGSADHFQLAIWYANLPGDPTIVWSPNRDSPVGRDAIVRLDRTGNLILIDRNTLIWSSNTSGRSVEYAVMSDSGSLILYSSAVSGSASDLQVAWQSFWHPSDTLLPSQPLGASLELTSTKTQSGYYSLKLLQQQTSRRLALTYETESRNSSSLESHANYTYWSSQQISNATREVFAVLDYSGSFSISYGESSAGMVYVHKSETGENQSILRRIMIGADGNLRLYRWNNITVQWDTEWSAVSNPCQVAGICGDGICNLEGSKSSWSCTSLPPLDLGNCSGGSKRMEVMQQTSYSFLGASVIANYSNVSISSECGNHCLLDCSCVASVYGLVAEEAYCWTLRSMVFGGLQDPRSTLFVKVGINSSSGTTDGSKDGHNHGVVLLPLLLCISVLVVLLGLLLCYSVQSRRMRLQKGMISSSLSLREAPQKFSYHDLQTATGNFSRLLGTGSFGSVYKGTLKDGTSVAVKKLERILPHGEKEFETEVNTIGAMHHMNLVRLYGFYFDQSQLLLVYEYMSNGSLDKWIFPLYNKQDRLLDWPTRFQIAIGIAKGIAYFHEQCKNRIIHCDIKPENILLDENFCPKISDFGLAKLMSREHSHVITMVRGTRGYLAPEWVSNRPITVKADVYSYGMLLLEIVGGRRNLDMSLDSEEFFYPGLAFMEMSNGTPLKAADKRLKGKVEEEELVRALNAAFRCIQEEAWLRPSMEEVIRILEGSVEISTPSMPRLIQELDDEGLHSIHGNEKR